MRHPIVQQDIDRILSIPLQWDAFDGATVLVSGANGFIPAFLIELFLRLNETKRFRPARILALVRNQQRTQQRFAAYAGRPDLAFIVQDVSHTTRVPQPVDYIIHAASQASPRFYGADPVGTWEANVLGAHNLLSLARVHHLKGFLFLSSGEVYGCVNDDAALALGESNFGPLDPTNVRACYAESKRAAETLCACSAHQWGVPTHIARLFHTYGPGMRLDDGRVFADFVADILAGRDITVRSDGNDVRSFCYLADAVAGCLTVLLRGKPGEAYNVGNEKCAVRIGELAGTLAGLFPEKGLRVVYSNEDASAGYIRSPIRRSCPDTAKLRSLGWTPVTPIAEGFRQTVLSYQEPAPGQGLTKDAP